MKKYAKYPALAVTLAIMAVIFVLSSQPAELSTKVSRAVTETVQVSRIKAITPLWFSTTNLNANVRKWAHRGREGPDRRRGRAGAVHRRVGRLGREHGQPDGRTRKNHR